MHLKPELCAAIPESPRVYRWNYITEYRSAFISKPSTYFELLSPKTWNGEPHVVMISGGVHSTACYLVTPDGRPGWAHAFLREGYKVVLVDWPGVGRSGYVAPEELGGDLIVDGIGQVLEEIGGAVHCHDTLDGGRVRLETNRASRESHPETGRDRPCPAGQHGDSPGQSDRRRLPGSRPLKWLPDCSHCILTE